LPKFEPKKGKLYLFVAIDRTSKVAFARHFDKANTAAAERSLSSSFVLTDNGIQFADLPKNRSGRRPGSEAIPSIAPAPLTGSRG
jgi:hypothetical protein